MTGRISEDFKIFSEGHESSESHGKYLAQVNRFEKLLNQIVHRVEVLEANRFSESSFTSTAIIDESEYRNALLEGWFGLCD